jgi:hypothetical protein
VDSDRAYPMLEAVEHSGLFAEGVAADLDSLPVSSPPKNASTLKNLYLLGKRHGYTLLDKAQALPGSSFWQRAVQAGSLATVLLAVALGAWQFWPEPSAPPVPIIAAKQQETASNRQDTFGDANDLVANTSPLAGSANIKKGIAEQPGLSNSAKNSDAAVASDKKKPDNNSTGDTAENTSPLADSANTKKGIAEQSGLSNSAKNSAAAVASDKKKPDNNSTGDTIENTSPLADSVSKIAEETITYSGQPDNAKTYILLVGVGNYVDSKFPTLITPVNDVKLIANTLEKSVGVPSGQISILLNSRKSEFLSTLNDIKRKFKTGDQLVLFYSGHGVVYENNNAEKGYWAFYDTVASRPESWLSHEETSKILVDFPGGVWLVADSNFSGEFIAGRYVSDAKAVSYEDSDMAKIAFTSSNLVPIPDANNQLHSVFVLSFVSSIEKWSKKAREKGASNMPGIYIYLETRGKLDSINQKLPQYGVFKSSTKKIEGGKAPDFMLRLR